jgi:hypothetical protein
MAVLLDYAPGALSAPSVVALGAVGFLRNIWSIRSVTT